MLDYAQQISTFISDNFKVAESKEDANFLVSSSELLQFLFGTFPKDCISDYELNEILNKQGFQRGLNVYENSDSKKVMENVWLLHSVQLIEKS